MYSSSSADASVAVAESAGPSYSAKAVVVVAYNLISLTHRRLRRQRHLLGRVVSFASSTDSSVAVVETLE